MEAGDTEPLLSSSSDYKQACGVLSNLGGGAEINSPTKHDKNVVLPLSRNVSNELSEISMDGETSQNNDPVSDDNLLIVERVTHEFDEAQRFTQADADGQRTDQNDDVDLLNPDEFHFSQVRSPQTGTNSGAINALRSLVRDRSTEASEVAGSGQFSVSASDVFPTASTSINQDGPLLHSGEFYRILFINI